MPTTSEGDANVRRIDTESERVPRRSRQVTLTFEPVISPTLDEQTDALAQVYAAAFGRPPYCEPPESAARFVEGLRRHSRYPGFRCVVARDGETVIGFAYGYTSAEGQWWHDAVAGRLPSESARVWLSNAFEIVDLAVHPTAQGRGAGRELHDRILQGLPHRTAVLSTRNEETTALRLYRRSGWRAIATDFHFPGSEDSWLILGRELRGPE